MPVVLTGCLVSTWRIQVLILGQPVRTPPAMNMNQQGSKPGDMLVAVEVLAVQAFTFSRKDQTAWQSFGQSSNAWLVFNRSNPKRNKLKLLSR